MSMGLCHPHASFTKLWALSPDQALPRMCFQVLHLSDTIPRNGMGGQNETEVGQRVGGQNEPKSEVGENRCW